MRLWLEPSALPKHGGNAAHAAAGMPCPLPFAATLAKLNPVSPAEATVLLGPALESGACFVPVPPGGKKDMLNRAIATCMPGPGDVLACTADAPPLSILRSQLHCLTPPRRQGGGGH